MIRPLTLAGILAQRGDATSPLERDVTSVQSPPPQTVDYNTSFDELFLPPSVTVTLNDGTLATLPVSWAQGTYDELVPATYVLEGTLILPVGITNSTGIEATISVTVSDPLVVDVNVDGVNGDDDDGDGSVALPLATIHKGVEVAEALGGPRVVLVAPATYVLPDYLILPTGISLIGSGVDSCFITADDALDYSADMALEEWGFDKYIIQATSVSPTSITQQIRGFSIDGDTKSKHGGIYIDNRNGFILRELLVGGFNFTGIYFTNTDLMQFQSVAIVDCGLSNIDFTSGALMFGNNTNTTFNSVTVNEGLGRGVKLFNPNVLIPVVTNMRFVDTTLSVTPDVAYDGAALNYAVEMTDALMTGIEFNHCHLDNGLLFRTHQSQSSSYNGGTRVLYFTNRSDFDLLTRADGKGFAIQADCHNIEIDNAYFRGAGQNIFTANVEDVGQPAKNNWFIHHCTFGNPQTALAAAIVRSKYVPLGNLRFLNNTAEITDNNSVYILHTENGQINFNWTVKNNCINDLSTADSSAAQGGPNTFIKLDGGGAIQNLDVDYNCIFGMPIGAIPGGNYGTHNITISPQLTRTGNIPDPYYRPLQSSPLIYAGVNVGLPFNGLAPTIGAHEPTAVAELDIVSVETLDDILVPTGTLFNNIGLPSTVEVELEDGSTPLLAVTWAQGSYNPLVEDIYTLTGTIVLPFGVTNPLSLTPTINVIVGEAIIVFEDDFDRTASTPGASYTVEGTMTFNLNGEDMFIDGADGQLSQRILLNTSIAGLNDLRVIVDFTVAEYGATTYGIGFGIQNQVNPDPNKGVFGNFWMNSVNTPGRLEILGGNGTTSNTGFTSRSTAPTFQPMALANNFIGILERRLDGSDLVWTATVTNTATQFENITTWRETGAGSLVYEGTSKVTIYRFGGLLQVNRLIVQDLLTENPFPDVVSVEAVPDINVANGTAFGVNGVGVGLPATLDVTLSDASVVPYSVVWSIGSYSATTAGPYTITGTITLPPSVTNTTNITASALVTVASPTTAVTFDIYVDSAAADDVAAGTVGDPYKTIQAAFNAAGPGDTIGVRGSSDVNNPKVYREGVVPPNSGTTGNPITVALYPGEYATWSGLEVIPNTGWTVDAGNVYRKAMSVGTGAGQMPVNGYQNSTNLTSNTFIMENQIFRNGSMMFEARWPKVTTEADLLDFSKMRHHSSGSHTDTRGFNYTSVNDAAISASTGSGGMGLTAGALTGARFMGFGWFWNHNRIISGHPSNNVINFPAISSNSNDGCRYRKYWYVTGKRALLTTEKEWHYDGTNLYFWQPGGGTISGVIEIKKRNWALDLRGKSNITVTGLKFVGCEPASGDTNTNNIIIDNIRATFTNHCSMWADSFPGYGNAKATGMKLIGSNNIIKNSEIRYAAGAGVWLGQNGRMENNWIRDINYEGGWGAPAMGWLGSGNIVITRNSFDRTGRSNVDIGTSYAGQNNPPSFALNWELSYNVFRGWGMINVDLGAHYSWGFRDLTGLEIHHNWFCYDGVRPDPQIAPGGGQTKLDGGQRCSYFDQASGPSWIYKNVYFRTYTTITQDVSEIYNQMHFEVRTAGSSLIANNTIASLSGQNISYTTYETGPKDIQRNNYYAGRINHQWGASNPPNETNSVFRSANVVLAAGQSATYLGANSIRNTTPLFVGGTSGPNGLDYLLTSGSPLRGRATAVPEIGITAGMDCGAYQFADNANPWVPGYVEVPYFIPDPVDPGTVDIDTIDTVVNDFEKPYATAFGTNGAGLGLPQTISVTYDDASTGTLAVTWTGTYLPLSGPWDDVIFTLTGTPVLTGDVTNSGSLTLSVDVTVRDMLFPLTSTQVRVSDSAGLVNNTTNAYGIVATGVVTQSDSYKGLVTTDMVQNTVGPTLTAGQLVFTGTQRLHQTVNNTDFEYMHYNATPANIKWIVLKVLTITDIANLFFIFGNNGFYEGNNGIALGVQTSGGLRRIDLKITGNLQNAVLASHNTVFTPGTKFLLTYRFDNSLLPAAGKCKAYGNTTLYSATSTGTGVFDNVPIPSDRMEIGNCGAGASYNFQGSMGPEIWLNGTESDAVLLKLQQDLIAYCGIIEGTTFASTFDTTFDPTFQ